MIALRLIELGMRKLFDFLESEKNLLKEGFKYVRNCLETRVCKERKAFAISTKLLILHEELKELAVEIIARYQPVASDLRFIVSSMEVSYDLYRVSRYLAEIERLLRLAHNIHCNYENVIKLYNVAEQMIYEAVNVFLEKRANEAQKIVEIDNTIDRAYIESIENAIRSQELSVCDALKTLIFRHLERIGDHATYIANSAIYVVTGRRPEAEEA
ncbi:MAG TPA: phosphate uptake regulator PhoU [Pyrodictiaceae archaeon]|nr:phosphate uptake regulator PhoU [Pyrodictiaceae archaeon]